MTTAVLKNRLIQLSKGSFRESEHGAKSMVELIEQAKDVVVLDKSQFPHVVELISSGVDKEALSLDEISMELIRPDLWQATMDYTSGNQYVWDTKKGTARPRIAEDSADYLLPTITSQVDAAWRKEFVEKVIGANSGALKKRLSAFVERSVSPRVLPRAVLVKWNDFVKEKIQQMLSKWFEDHKIQPPEKFVVKTIRRLPRIAQEDEVEQLRDLIVACVRGMSPQELATINLPPLALLRTRKDKSGA